MNAVPRPSLTLAAMAEAELDEVLAIERAVYEYPWSWGNFNDSMRAGYGCWTCRLGSELVGYFILMVAAEEAHLLNLSIAARFQRQGHGRWLLEQALRLARDQGARLLFLEVRPSNPGARQLYASRGFREIGRRRDYYPAHNGREDALVMALDIGAPAEAGRP